MRNFSLVVLDLADNIIDKLNFDFVSEPKGLGIKIKIETITSDLEDEITKIIQEKQEIQFKVHHVKGYIESVSFAKWIEKYIVSDYKMALEYSVNNSARYSVGKITSYSKSELNEFSVLERDLTFMPTTPFFKIVANQVRIQMSSEGKSYPFRYPYSYGKNVIENNDIDNTYILSVPLIVFIYGNITNPVVQLLDEKNNAYNKVEFLNFDLKSDEHIVINSADKKIWLWNGSKYVDFTPNVNPAYDSFLRANRGKSKININLSASDKGYLLANWRQYGIDS